MFGLRWILDEGWPVRWVLVYFQVNSALVYREREQRLLWARRMWSGRRRVDCWVPGSMVRKWGMTTADWEPAKLLRGVSIDDIYVLGIAVVLTGVVAVGSHGVSFARSLGQNSGKERAFYEEDPN